MGNIEAVKCYLAYVTPGLEHAGSENVHVIPGFLGREHDFPRGKYEKTWWHFWDTTRCASIATHMQQGQRTQMSWEQCLVWGGIPPGFAAGRKEGTEVGHSCGTDLWVWKAVLGWTHGCSYIQDCSKWLQAGAWSCHAEKALTPVEGLTPVM